MHVYMYACRNTEIDRLYSPCGYFYMYTFLFCIYMFIYLSIIPFCIVCLMYIFESTVSISIFFDIHIYSMKIPYIYIHILANVYLMYI